MAGKSSLTKLHLNTLFSDNTIEELETKLTPKLAPPPKLLPPCAKTNLSRVNRSWSRLTPDQPAPEALLDPWTQENLEAYTNNIENCIGTIKIPVGIAGPLRVNGLYAQGDYHIPLATTEAALVASYHRGTCIISEAGGCTSMLLYQAVNRAPAFAFENMRQAGRFVAWAIENFENFQQIAATTTSHGKLVDIGTQVEGNHVYLNLEYHTADASGQNMVTIATQAICDHIASHSPVKPTRAYVEGNLSGDKKASAQAYTSVRGKKVTAEITIPSSLVVKRLHATPRQLVDYWQMSAIGGVLSGTIGIQGHFANGLTALYLATGQDAACVAESAIGVTRFELTDSGDLYAAVTLPAIMVGTVGGGTGLPSQKECLKLMNLLGAGKSSALAEVTAGLLLAGEISIIGALAAGHFSRAHHKLARK